MILALGEHSELEDSEARALKKVFMRPHGEWDGRILRERIRGMACCVSVMIIDSPVGALHAAFDEAGRLSELGFRPRGGVQPSRLRAIESSGLRVVESSRGESTTPQSSSNTRRLEDLKTQLAEYFAGSRKQFDLELAPRGTPFQSAVWQELLTIPFGHTISYADLARRIGKENAVRAVGAANGANPIPVIIPCHRVIGSNGALTGYGGGIERKQWLLTLEGRRLF